MLLDSLGAQKMSYKDIAIHLHEKYQISSWLSQMVTATYEQKKGLRNKHKRPDGYSISISRDIQLIFYTTFGIMIVNVVSGLSRGSS